MLTNGSPLYAYLTVDVDLAEAAPKDLEKVGVYGFVTDTGKRVS